MSIKKQNETEMMKKKLKYSLSTFPKFKDLTRVRTTLEEENNLLSDAIIAILDIPTKSSTIKKVRVVIKNLNPKKAPDYDFITNQILQKLPEIEI